MRLGGAIKLDLYRHNSGAQMVFALRQADVMRAGEIVQSRELLSARDSVHIAVMERHEIRSILSFDGDFDRWPGLKRIYKI